MVWKWKATIIDTVKSENIARISHIGSNSVEGLIAKPIIDILLEMIVRVMW